MRRINLVSVALSIVAAAMPFTIVCDAPRAASVTLRWTAPGDDGTVGTSAEYDVRYFGRPITSANWDSCLTVSGEPVPKIAGSAEVFTLPTVFTSGTFYFALKARDESNNWSGLSNVVSKIIDEIEPAAIVDLRAD